jgi:ABC-2 type transport system ATP-binding protein
MIAEPAIQTADLSKVFRGVTAVHGLNLVVEANRITGFLGRNGAGKSTTIKMLLCLVRPTEGEGLILGKRITDPKANREARRHIAYVAEDKPLYRYMTVEQTIRFAASFYGDWRPDVASNLLREFELPQGQKVKHLSKGMRTKLALLLAFSRNPQLLILDEPSEGLDPVMIERLLQLMVAQAGLGTAVFFSSHQIAEVERISDQICILDRGRLLLDSSLERLRQDYRRIDLSFQSEVVKQDFELPGIERMESSGRQLRLLTSGNAEMVIKRAHELNALSIEMEPVGLRDIFLEMVKEK